VGYKVRDVEKGGDNSTHLWITMFIGEYTYSLDTKRRLSVPATFRKLLGAKAVVTKGIDNCLVLYTKKEWDKKAEKISQYPETQASARKYSRGILAAAIEVNIDRLGRILLPDYLKKYAGLKKKTVFAGLYNRIEIWDEATWNKYTAQNDKEMGNTVERLKELGV